jgi:hypothetical protein
MTLTLEDYASTEKIGHPPRKLSTAGAPAGVDPSVGDIAYGRHSGGDRQRRLPRHRPTRQGAADHAGQAAVSTFAKVTQPSSAIGWTDMNRRDVLGIAGQTLARRIAVQERPGLHPVLVRPVHFQRFRAGIGLGRAHAAAARLAGVGIGQIRIREGERPPSLVGDRR